MPTESARPTVAEIKKRFDYVHRAWQKIYDEADIDIQYLSGDPWTEKERGERGKRPCISSDKLNQFKNQVVNETMRSPRETTVVPRGNGASDKTALVRTELMREIQYESNANDVYSWGYDGAVGNSIGVWRVNKEYVDELEMHQQLRIKRVQNYRSVYFDPDAKEADFSDGNDLFVFDKMPLEQFNREYKGAEPVSFTDEEVTASSDWITGDRENREVRVAEYWKVHKDRRDLVVVDVGAEHAAQFGPSPAQAALPDAQPAPGAPGAPGAPPVQPQAPGIQQDATGAYPVRMILGKGKLPDGILRGPDKAKIERTEDGEVLVVPEGAQIETETEILTFHKGARWPIINRRKTEIRRVVQYITNGVEILEENEWDGNWIPLIACTGKEMYVKEGGKTERRYLSLIRLARDPFKLFLWLRSNEMEEGGMTPKTPWLIADGAQTGREQEWENVNRDPLAFITYKPVKGPDGQWQWIKPERMPYVPNFPAYEGVIATVNQDIQSSMGMYNASVGRHDSQVKSGVQQKALDEQSAQGSFHFVANLNAAIKHTGRILNDLIPKVYDTPREVGLRSADGKYRVVKVNDPGFMERNAPQHYDLLTGDHGVTITVGPTFDSQRDAADSLIETVVQALPTFQFLPPQVKAKILSIAIKLKNIGPLGEALSQLLDPTPADQADLPPGATAQIQAAKEDAQKLNAHAAQLEQGIQQLLKEKEAKMWDAGAKLELEKMRGEFKVLIAEITTKAQTEQARLKADFEAFIAAQDLAHEAGSQAAAQAHEQDLAASDQAHQQEMAAQAAPPAEPEAAPAQV